MVRMRKATGVKAYPAKTLPSEAVEAYIAGVPEPVRTTLRHLREIIRSAVPAEATEIISYGLPAFSLSKPFFGYAAFKGHLSVLPFSGSLLDRFAEETQTLLSFQGYLSRSARKWCHQPIGQNSFRNLDNNKMTLS
jgi:uncharacterized protein YdhG (YjbR/CyaY superfamily)